MSDASYNPTGSESYDNAEFKDGSDVLPRGVRSGVESGVNANREDAMAAESDRTGRIPKGEAEGLINELTPEERDVSGRTRGVKVDAFAQERKVDAQVDDASEGRDAYNAGF